MSINGPIPGQSLTDEPKNYPWERPPEITDFNESIKYHIDRLSDPEVMDNVLFALEFGVPSGVLSEAMMTGAVAKGIHSIDIGLMASSVVHEFIQKIADETGLNYKKEFKEDEVDPIDRAAVLIRKSLKQTPEEQKDSGYEMLAEISEGMESKSDSGKASEGDDKDKQVEEPVPTGLMARV